MQAFVRQPLAGLVERLKISRLASHGFVYFLGEAGSKALAFLFLILLARWTGPTAFGTLNVYVSLVGLVGAIIGLGLPNAVLRFHFKTFDFASVLGTSVAIIVGASVVLGVLVWTGSDAVERYFHIAAPLLYLSVPGGLAIAIRSVWLSSLRATRLSAIYSWSQLTEPLLFVVGVLIYFGTGRSHSVLPILVLYSSATAVIDIGAVLRWSRDPGLRINLALGRPLVLFAVPLMLHGFAMMALNTADQIIINQLKGEAATGLYAFAYRFGMAMLITSTAFSSSWMPEFLDLVRTAEGRARLNGLAQRYMNVMIAIAVAFMATLPLAARWLGGAEYRAVVGLIPVVVYGYVWFIAYTLVIGYSMHEERTPIIAVGTALTMATNVALNYLWVPRFGVAGAAWATVLSYALLFAVQLWMARRYAVDIGFARIAGKVMILAPFTVLLEILLGRW